MASRQNGEVGLQRVVPGPPLVLGRTFLVGMETRVSPSGAGSTPTGSLSSRL